MVQLDDVENAAKLIAAFAPRLEPGLDLLPLSAPPALRHRRHPAPGRGGRARAGAARGGRARARAAARWTARWSRSPGGPTPRSSATCWPRPASTPPRRTRAGRRCSDAAVAAYETLCPPDLSDRVAPGVAELLPALAARPGDVPALARDRQPRGDRAPQARPRRARRLLRAGPGRLRLRPPRARRAAADRAPASRAGDWPRERTVVIGDTPRDIACARADGVRVVGRRHRPVRDRGAGGRGRRGRRRPRPAAGARGLR